MWSKERLPLLLRIAEWTAREKDSKPKIQFQLGGKQGLEFSHALPVVVERRRRREHSRIRRIGSLVPARPPILGDADTGAGGPRRGRNAILKIQVKTKKIFQKLRQSTLEVVTSSSRLAKSSIPVTAIMYVAAPVPALAPTFPFPLPLSLPLFDPRDVFRGVRVTCSSGSSRAQPLNAWQGTEECKGQPHVLAGRKHAHARATGGGLGARGRGEYFGSWRCLGAVGGGCSQCRRGAHYRPRGQGCLRPWRGASDGVLGSYRGKEQACGRVMRWSVSFWCLSGCTARGSSALIHLQRRSRGWYHLARVGVRRARTPLKQKEIGAREGQVCGDHVSGWMPDRRGLKG